MLPDQGKWVEMPNWLANVYQTSLHLFMKDVGHRRLESIGQLGNR